MLQKIFQRRTVPPDRWRELLDERAVGLLILASALITALWAVWLLAGDLYGINGSGAVHFWGRRAYWAAGLSLLAIFKAYSVLTDHRQGMRLACLVASALWLMVFAQAWLSNLLLTPAASSLAFLLINLFNFFRLSIGSLKGGPDHDN